MKLHRLIVFGLISSAGCSSPVHGPSAGIQIDRARQALGYSNRGDNDLELSVTITNHGGAPIVLSPALFQLQTADGLLRSPDILPYYRWIDAKGTTTDNAELAGGASFSGFPLAFDVTAANAVKLVFTVASTDEPLAQDTLDTVSAALPALDACAPCGALCAYLEIDTGVCCDGPTPAGGSCVDHVGTCPSGLALCSGSCVDLTANDANCGACGAQAPNGGSCDGGTPSCGELTNCSSQCTDVTADSANCGACGKACPTGLKCRNSVCDSAVKFPVSPAQSCDNACASLGATCADANGFACGYVDSDSVGINGACGSMTGDDYDNSGIPGGGGSAGIDWHGSTCATVASGLEDYFECHCVAP